MAKSPLLIAAEHIDTMIFEKSDAILDVKNAAEKLRNELKKLDALYINADSGNNEQNRSLVAKLEKIAYDAEDVVDTLETEFESKGSIRRSLLFSSSSSSKKIQEVLDQINQTRWNNVHPESGEGSRHGLGSSGSPKKKLMEEQLHGPTPFEAHLQAHDDFVVGIQDDVKSLVEDVLVKTFIKDVWSWVKDVLVKAFRKDDITFHDSEKPVNVLAIVGMGGSGKTTLARNIYKDRTVRKYFKKQAWVALLKESWEWDEDHEKALMSGLVRQLETTPGAGNNTLLERVASHVFPEHYDQNRSNESEDDLLSIKTRLQRILSKETCLVVLDDVWHWTSFQRILHNLVTPHQGESIFTSSGTKIVITSRQHPQLLPDTPVKWQCHFTQCLGDEDSWVLFNEVSRSNNGKELAARHEGLAKEMLKTCKGLPLAIVALGRLLKTKDTIQEWERVFSHLDGEQGTQLYRPVNDILAFSFDELPTYLKPCFLYLGLLAENSTISAGSLKRMWIAEGFVKGQERDNETPEDAAKRLLQELVEHTMVQVVTKTYAGKVKTLRVHDIMRDLCILKAQEQDFLTIFSSDSDQGVGNHSSRRAAFNLSKCSIPLSVNNPNLRSLLLFGESSPGVAVARKISRMSQHRKLNLDFVCEKFKLLRVLDINGIKTSDGTLTKEIGSLIHLRYLRIRSTNIRQLPKSIGKLRKLVTLDYWDVSAHNNEVRLPTELGNLERLRHLFLPGDLTSNTMKELRLGSLNDLHTLWGVKGGNWMLKELNNLSVTLKKLCIQGISSEEQLKAVFTCPVIKGNDNLYALALDWYDFSLEPSTLEALSSKRRLNKLRLIGRAPDVSISLEFPTSLGKLELHFTKLEEQKTMDVIGELRNLKFLELAKDAYMGEKWICKEYSFPKLEELKLCDLPKLDTWEMGVEAMSGLKKLSIVSCISLKRLPKEVKNLRKLETLEITRMPTDFSIRIIKVKSWDSTITTTGRGQDFHIVQHIANIGIRDSCHRSLSPNDGNEYSDLSVATSISYSSSLS